MEDGPISRASAFIRYESVIAGFLSLCEEIFEKARDNTLEPQNSTLARNPHRVLADMGVAIEAAAERLGAIKEELLKQSL